MDIKIYELMNDQVNKELYSAYVYLDMANYYTDENLDGFANWFRAQAQEERDHAFKFIDYLQDNSQSVNLLAIDKPEYTYNSYLEPLEIAYEHEKKVTALINAIYAQAHEKKDFRAMQFLDWFIEEQAEEEKTANDLVEKMKLFGSDTKALYLINEELATRVYTPPVTTEE